MAQTATSQLVYTEDELMSEHDFARPHIVSGHRMHGGFMANGSYQPPRALVREPALDAWAKALRERGGDLLDADSSLLDGVRVPNIEQSKLLVRSGLGQHFWNGLTITGKIEARGRLLADASFPDMQDFIVDDISTLAIGHLNKGLLRAHGIDEGGQPESGVGGHDAMWFVLRDLAFGAGAYPDVEPPDNIARAEAGPRLMPEISPVAEGLLSLLMNLLVIEFRAEIGFASVQAVLRSPDLFTDRRAAATEAAEIVGRIRADEEIHVTSLRLYLGELASVTFRTDDGGVIAGSELIGRFWDGLVRWATVDQPALVAERERATIVTRIREHPESRRVLAEFDALSR